MALLGQKLQVPFLGGDKPLNLSSSFSPKRDCGPSYKQSPVLGDKTTQKSLQVSINSFVVSETETGLQVLFFFFFSRRLLGASDKKKKKSDRRNDRFSAADPVYDEEVERPAVRVGETMLPAHVPCVTLHRNPVRRLRFTTDWCAITYHTSSRGGRCCNYHSHCHSHCHFVFFFGGGGRIYSFPFLKGSKRFLKYVCFG